MNDRTGTDRPEQPLLQVEALVKTYVRPKDQVEVLRGLDLSLEAGETLAVLGASGVGKSTLLHILGALDRPTRGSVRFEGQEIFRWNDNELARFRNRAIGFVFQFHHLMPEFNALENAMMPCLVAGMPKARARARAEELMEQVGLSHRTDHRIGELSGGEQQRVAVARALIMRPRLLLADEPTGNLDGRTGAKVNEMMMRLNRDLGLTTVVATHNRELADLMDRRINLVDGRAESGGPWPGGKNER